MVGGSPRGAAPAAEAHVVRQAIPSGGNNVSPWVLRTETRRALDALASLYSEFVALVPHPRFIGEPGRQWWRFPNDRPAELILVKLARIVSGLNAIAVLLENYYTVEANVVLRTVDDFVDEVTFLLEGLQAGKLNVPQQQFVKDFFAEQVKSPDELLSAARSPDRAKKRHVQAAQGRYLGPSNPDRFQRMARAIDDTLNGYVHGAYPHSMELWVGNQSGGRFTLAGTKGAPYAEAYWRQHALYVSRALSVTGMVALFFSRPDLSARAKVARDRFEASPEYDDDEPAA